MTNKSNASKNFFETLVDAQTQTLDTMVETAKKFTNGNAVINETIEKGTDFVKKSVNATKETLEKATTQASKMQDGVKNSTDMMTSFFENWKNQQTQASNQMKELNTQFLQYWMNPSNTQSFFQNMPNQWSNMSNMFNANTMQNAMGNMMNPTAWQDQMTAANDQMKSFWNQFQSVINNNYTDFAKNLQNGTIQDAFKGMVNMNDGFAKFYEMWMPMMKSMNDKTFNMDTFMKNFDMNQYKAFMDKYFSFVPQTNQDYVNNMKNMFTDLYKQNSQMSKDMMNNVKSSMTNMFPMMNENPFANMINGYNQMQGQMMAAVSPFAKLMTPNNDTKTMNEWAEIFNKMNIYNIKSAELQYMVYETGKKVMESIAEKTMHKIENGEDVNSMMKLYQEWLNLSDAQYVKMFETDEYSKLMAEVSSLQMSIKKDIERQMEKSFANVPVATRSDMDEVYQTIYDLKKELRAMQAAFTGKSVPTPAKKATTPKAAAPAKKATPAKKVVAKKTTKRK